MRKTLLLSLLGLSAFAQTAPWTAARANSWYARQPWLVGANYSPANAINQLEMWQPSTFDPKRIDLELGWAESLGMNTMRVFLHDLPYKEDPAGFKKRVDTFLSICAKHKIRPMLVLFDSVWDPQPKSGTQRAPRPGVHNSGWVQGPGAAALTNPADVARLEAYVKGIVGAFAKDDRILAWDIWNEPDNDNASSYKATELKDKAGAVLPLLRKSFEWARQAGATQPLTSGVWQGDWSPSKLSPMAKAQLELSDVISFHNYDPAASFESRVKLLLPLGRPLLCTEYMARGNGSFFNTTMPLGKKYNIALYNWGLVAGKTQTNLPWDSWQKPYTDREPSIWFHEVFHTDGKPYRQEEVDYIRSMTKAKK